MPDEPAKPDPANLSPEELLRLRTLTTKRNEALNNMSNAIKKQDEARRAIIDKMR